MKKRVLPILLSMVLALHGTVPAFAEIDETDDYYIEQFSEDEGAVSEEEIIIEDEEIILDESDALIAEEQGLFLESEEDYELHEDILSEENTDIEPVINETGEQENDVQTEEDLVEETVSDGEVIQDELSVGDIQQVGGVTASGTCGDNLTWELTDDGVLTISGTGDMWNWNPYDSGDNAHHYTPWQEYSNIREIDIRNGVTSIGDRAFSDCDNLMALTIPDNVKTVGDFAFSGSDNLTDLTIGNGVTRIGYGAFQYCERLSIVSVGDSVKTIEEHAFYNCGRLKYITLGKSVELIGKEAFFNCDWFQSVIIPNSVETIAEGAFYSCSSLENVIIGNNVKTIGKRAFTDVPLRTIKIPDCVINIENEAFNGSYLLNSITVSSGNPSYSSLNGVLYNKDKTIIIKCPEGKTGLFSIPDSVVTIGSSAFETCEGLRGSLIIPDSVKTIGDYAFQDCTNLNSVEVGSSVKTIGYSAFSGCTNLNSVEMGNNVEAVDEWAFGNCKNLFSIILSSRLKTIGYCAFNGCSSLTSITFPKSVTAIGNNAFSNCTNLGIIEFKGDAPEFLLNSRMTFDSKSRAFNNVTAIVYYPFNNPTWTADVLQDYDGNLTWTTNSYDWGDETYSFKNYGDYHSSGHCFGMSMTSSGYHNGFLDIGIIGGNTLKVLYSFEDTPTVRNPICYYQERQGSFLDSAIVSSGSGNPASYWKGVVDYVRNHSFDYTGLLVLGMWHESASGHITGHAVNFLRYENVNGQDRIYVYDNNFPRKETYFYWDSESGSIRQAPLQTYSDGVSELFLLDCRVYFSNVGDFDITHVLYMNKDAAIVKGHEFSYMISDPSVEEQVMYEIPEGEDQVIIIPNKDNAEFIYMDKVFSFGEITDETYGVLKLASSDEGNDNTDGVFSIENEGVTNPEPTIKLSTKEANLLPSQTQTISVSDMISGDKVVSWKSENTTVATVNNGTIAAKNPGTTKVTVTLLSGLTADIKVTVLEPTIKLSASSITVYTEKTQTITASGLQPGDKIRYWGPADSSIAVAAVRDNVITVKGKKAGKTTVTLTLLSGLKVRITVNVKDFLTQPKLIAAYNGAYGIGINFFKVENATEYVIYRKFNGVWETIRTISATSNELKFNGDRIMYTDTTVAKNYGKGYIYSVAAKNGKLLTTIDMVGRAIYRLNPPTITTVVNSAKETATVTWKGVFGKTETNGNYDLQFAELVNGKAGEFQSVITKPGYKYNILKADVKGLKKGKTYAFRIRCSKTNKDRGTFYSEYSPWRTLKITK